MYDTTAEQDKAIMNSFDEKISQGSGSKSDSRGRAMSFSVLKSEYHAVENNCTTQSVEGIGAGNKGLASRLSDAKESKGRGLGFMEKIAAGNAVGGQIFMPQDLQANVEADKSYIEKSLYQAGGVR